VTKQIRFLSKIKSHERRLIQKDFKVLHSTLIDELGNSMDLRSSPFE
jgi:hypothetical protein